MPLYEHLTGPQRAAIDVAAKTSMDMFYTAAARPLPDAEALPPLTPAQQAAAKADVDDKRAFTYRSVAQSLLNGFGDGFDDLDIAAFHAEHAAQYDELVATGEIDEDLIFDSMARSVLAEAQ